MIFPIIHFQEIQSSQRIQFQSVLKKSEFKLEEDNGIEWINTDLSFNDKVSRDNEQGIKCYDSLGCFPIEFFEKIMIEWVLGMGKDVRQQIEVESNVSSINTSCYNNECFDVSAAERIMIEKLSEMSKDEKSEVLSTIEKEVELLKTMEHSNPFRYCDETLH